MTDRELLEAAARTIDLWPSPEPFEHVLSRWNPLENDGDAFRLAVDLKAKIVVGNAIVMVEVIGIPDVGQTFHEDPHAATRRAIVRAAASRPS